MTKLGGLTPDQMKRVWRATLEYEARFFKSDDPLVESLPYIYVRNDDPTQDIPAYGCMQYNGTFIEGNQSYISVIRPKENTTATITPFQYLFASHNEIKRTEYGVAQNGPVYRVTTDGSFALGQRLGPKMSSFDLVLGSIWTYIGSDNRRFGNGGRVILHHTPLLGNSASGIAANSSATVNILARINTGWGSPASSNTTTAYNPTTTAIAANKLIMLFPIDARWVAVELC